MALLAFKQGQRQRIKRRLKKSLMRGHFALTGKDADEVAEEIAGHYMRHKSAVERERKKRAQRHRRTKDMFEE